MIVLDPNLDEAGVEAVTTRISNLATQRGGSIESVESGPPWGRRRLAYPISRYRDGFYVLSRMRLPPRAAAEIERTLKLTESIIRHLLVRADELKPAPAAAHA
jgi:small subunit ribosomal protein S6